MIENFEAIVQHIGKLKKEMFDEQQILFDNTLQNIEEKIKQAEQSRIHNRTESEIKQLRDFILE